MKAAIFAAVLVACFAAASATFTKPTYPVYKPAPACPLPPPPAYWWQCEAPKCGVACQKVCTEKCFIAETEVCKPLCTEVKECRTASECDTYYKWVSEPKKYVIDVKKASYYKSYCPTVCTTKQVCKDVCDTVPVKKCEPDCKDVCKPMCKDPETCVKCTKKCDTVVETTCADVCHKECNPVCSKVCTNVCTEKPVKECAPSCYTKTTCSDDECEVYYHKKEIVYEPKKLSYFKTYCPTVCKTQEICSEKCTIVPKKVCSPVCKDHCEDVCEDVCEKQCKDTCKQDCSEGCEKLPWAVCTGCFAKPATKNNNGAGYLPVVSYNKASNNNAKANNYGH